MTTDIRGLLVHDEPRDVPIIRDSMDLEFDDIGVKAIWADAADATSARKMVRDRPLFDFAIVDYGLGEGQQNGIAVVEEIRARGRTHTYVLVVSVRGNEFPRFRDEALRAGANDAVIRSALNTGQQDELTFRDLANKIRLHLARKRDIEGLHVEFTDGDIGLESTLHSIGSPAPPGTDSVAIGKDIVRSLAIDSLAPNYQRNTTTLAVGYLAPGRSGAHVCRVDRIEDNSTTSYVLKIGLDRRALAFERDANKRALRLLGPGDLVSLSSQIRTHDGSGYSAVAAELASEAVTLADWLSQASGPEAERIADILFGTQLAKLFTGQVQTKPVGEWLAATPVLRLRARDTIALYGQIWAELEGAVQPDSAAAAVLIDFLDHGVLPGGWTPGGETIFVDAFGDLHSTNVLVDTRPHGRPVLVDASMYAPNHWAADASRLVVDLALSVRRMGSASLLWPDAAEVSAYTDGLCGPARAARPAAAAEPVDAFIGKVIDKLPIYVHAEPLHMTTEQWHWQWHAALAKELIRQGSRSGMAGPRAVAALTSAVHQLEFAADAVAVVDFIGRDGKARPPICVAGRAAQSDPAASA